MADNVAFRILGRNLTPQVATASAGPYTTISGVMNISVAREDTRADATTFAGRGYTANVPTDRTMTIGIEAQWQVDPTTGERDSGQAMVEAAMKVIGPGRLRYYRFGLRESDTDATEIGHFVISAMAYPSEATYSTNELVNWTIELQGVSHPVVASGVFSDFYEAPVD